MLIDDLPLLLLGTFLELVATAAIVIGPELLDCLRTLMSGDSWPGEF